METWIGKKMLPKKSFEKKKCLGSSGDTFYKFLNCTLRIELRDRYGWEWGGGG
jgi:hypothetical protein